MVVYAFTCLIKYSLIPFFQSSAIEIYLYITNALPKIEKKRKHEDLGDETGSEIARDNQSEGTRLSKNSCWIVNPLDWSCKDFGAHGVIANWLGRNGYLRRNWLAS